MSAFANTGYAVAHVRGSYVPIASFAAAQKAERLFAVFDEPPYGTSMPGAGAVHTWHKATFAAPHIFGGYRGIADIDRPRACACLSNSDARRSAMMFKRTYRGACLIGFHSRASFCASAICAGVMFPAALSRSFTASWLPCAADKLNHMWALTKSCCTP